MSLNGENQQGSWLDRFKWLIAFILLLAGLIGNYYYSDLSWTLRLLGWAGVLAVVGLFGFTTQQGKWLLSFLGESRTELRKVVWPTREETMQTTLVVALMVVVLALILWGVDGLLVWLIGWLTGQRG